MEKFDVYNIKREKQNYTKERSSHLNSNEYNLGAEIWIFVNHQLLITQRSKEKSHPFEWEVPGGCSIASEDTIDTIIREIREELSLELPKDKIKIIKTTIYKQQFVDIYLYTTNKLEGIKLQKDELNNFRLVNKKEFLNLKNNIVQSVFERYETIKDIIKNNW